MCTVRIGRAQWRNRKTWVSVGAGRFDRWQPHGMYSYCMIEHQRRAGTHCKRQTLGEYDGLHQTLFRSARLKDVIRRCSHTSYHCLRTHSIQNMNEHHSNSTRSSRLPLRLVLSPPLAKTKLLPWSRSVLLHRRLAVKSNQVHILLDILLTLGPFVQGLQVGCFGRKPSIWMPNCWVGDCSSAWLLFERGAWSLVVIVE